MPRNGKLVRVSLAFGAAALVGALVAASATAAHKRRNGGTLNGAGSSLVAPAIQGVWMQMYQAAKGVTVNYASVGSGTGIADISARSVDFGASDAPFTPSQAAGCVHDGISCIEIPWALAATGPVVNIPNVKQGGLKLSGAVLAKIYLGQITNWDDPAIKALNSGLNLPDLKITVVHRSDGSGDTYAFTNYLSKISPTWKRQVGFATTVSWPGSTVGGKGNSGVAAIVGSTPGSIGYVSTAYVLQNHLTMAKLKNASGNYVLPRIKSIEAAAQLVRTRAVKPNSGISIVDPPRTRKRQYAAAWPISTFTYVMVPETTPNAAALKAFITWALSPTAQKAIQKLVFAPMPAKVVAADKKALQEIKSS
jgi:phosphate transport system substrate-binding protein